MTDVEWPEEEPRMSEALRQGLCWLGERLREVRDLGRSPEHHQEAARWLTGNDRFLPVEQAEIYRRQFWLRHTQSLVEDYPGLGGILGQRDWERLVEGYLSEQPPRHWSLARLADRLPEYLQRQAWVPHPELCLGMARLERAFCRVFDAWDAPPLRPEALLGLEAADFGAVRLVLAPLEAFLVRHPVDSLRQRLMAHEPGVPIPPPEPEFGLVVARDTLGTPLCHRADAAEVALLLALQGGTPLLAAAEAVEASRPGSVEPSIGAWLTRWASLGWVTALSAQSTSNG